MSYNNHLMDKIRQVNESGRIALCGYFLTGYKTPEYFYSMVRAAEKLDIIEFGIPSGNPVLDGHIISDAHDIVTNLRGIAAETALALIGGLRYIPQPRFVMTYTKDGRSLEGFLRKCVENDLHGIFAPDIEFKESRFVAGIAKTLNLAYISFIQCDSSEEEIKKRVEISDIIYIKISKGATGHIADIDGINSNLFNCISVIKKYKPDIIISAGIGIQKPDQIKLLAQLDINMAIVGTKIIERLESGREHMVNYISSLHKATFRPNR